MDGELFMTFIRGCIIIAVLVGIAIGLVIALGIKFWC